MGLTAGPVPPRADAHVKAGLLNLIGHARGAGWSRRRACALLGLDADRAGSWAVRAAAGDSLDDRPGGVALHGLLPAEHEAIVALFEAWGQVDRSHRKLAARGSREDMVHASASSVRRVLGAEGLVLQGKPARDPVVRAPWPDWVEWKPGRIWGFDFTHFTRAHRATVAVIDIVSRYWLSTITSPEETSTQVEAAFLAALDAEGMSERIDARLLAELRAGTATAADLDGPEAHGIPVLIAMSDNGPQMRSHSTREFMAACAIMQRFGRPGTPTDQAWIESFFGHLKGDWPHLEKITDPAVLVAELDRLRIEYNSVRLHAGIGYVTPEDEHHGRGDAIRQARRDGLARARQNRIAYHRDPARNPS